MMMCGLRDYTGRRARLHGFCWTRKGGPVDDKDDPLVAVLIGRDLGAC
jgi:hypothetical protein